MYNYQCSHSVDSAASNSIAMSPGASVSWSIFLIGMHGNAVTVDLVWKLTDDC